MLQQITGFAVRFKRLERACTGHGWEDPRSLSHCTFGGCSCSTCTCGLGTAHQPENIFGCECGPVHPGIHGYIFHCGHLGANLCESKPAWDRSQQGDNQTWRRWRSCETNWRHSNSRVSRDSDCCCVYLGAFGLYSFCLCFLWVGSIPPCGNGWVFGSSTHHYLCFFHGFCRWCHWSSVALQDSHPFSCHAAVAVRVLCQRKSYGSHGAEPAAMALRWLHWVGTWILFVPAVAGCFFYSCHQHLCWREWFRSGSICGHCGFSPCLEHSAAFQNPRAVYGISGKPRAIHLPYNSFLGGQLIFVAPQLVSCQSLCWWHLLLFCRDDLCSGQHRWPFQQDHGALPDSATPQFPLLVPSTLSLHWYSMPQAPNAQLQCVRWDCLQQFRRVQPRWSQTFGKTGLCHLQKLEIGASAECIWWKSPDEQSDFNQLCPLRLRTLQGGCALLSLAVNPSLQQPDLLLPALRPRILFVWCGSVRCHPWGTAGPTA